VPRAYERIAVAAHATPQPFLRVQRPPPAGHGRLRLRCASYAAAACRARLVPGVWRMLVVCDAGCCASCAGVARCLQRATAAAARRLPSKVPLALTSARCCAAAPINGRCARSAEAVASPTATRCAHHASRMRDPPLTNGTRKPLCKAGARGVAPKAQATATAHRSGIPPLGHSGHTSVCAFVWIGSAEQLRDRKHKREPAAATVQRAVPPACTKATTAFSSLLARLLRSFHRSGNTGVFGPRVPACTPCTLRPVGLRTVPRTRKTAGSSAQALGPVRTRVL
jgi:hypothetical protein